MVTRLALLVALVVGVFLLWVDAASVPAVVNLRERIGEGPPFQFGALLTFAIWVYCLYCAWRARRWEWVVIDVMLAIAIPLHILIGPMGQLEKRPNGKHVTGMALVSAHNRGAVGMAVRCPNPRCPNPNAIERVSDVVRSGTSTRSWIYGAIVTDMTDLANQLSMPPRPKVGAGPFALGMAILLGMLGVGGLIEFVFDPGFRRQNGVEGLVIAAVLIGLTVMVLNYRQAKIRSRNAAFARWPQQEETWEQLYFCSGCRSVFNPAEPSVFVPVARMEELLGS